MALPVNLYFRNLLLHNSRLFTASRLVQVTQIKTLYSASALGIENFLESRKRTNERFANYVDKFRSKMESFVQDENNMIFTDDLKNMVHIAEPSDADLVMKMIQKFNTNKEIRFGQFAFGPIVMRMFHFLDAPNEALQCFNDPANEGFFDQLISFQILLDLLYNNQMYDEIYQVFEVIKNKQINMVKFPKYSVVLVMATCYKQNTPESFEYAKNLWMGMKNTDDFVLRRTSAYFAALALNQGAPHIALEAISNQKQHYVTIRNIKAVALANLDRVDDALFVLRQVLDVDKPTNVKNTYFEETISKVRAAVEKANKTDSTKEFENIVKALQDRGLIDSQRLDTLLNSEINLKQHVNSNNIGDRRMNFAQRRRTMQ